MFMFSKPFYNLSAPISSVFRSKLACSSLVSLLFNPGTFWYSTLGNILVPVLQLIWTIDCNLEIPLIESIYLKMAEAIQKIEV